LSRQSVRRWRGGCQPYAEATLYPQEDSRGGVEIAAAILLFGHVVVGIVFILSCLLFRCSDAPFLSGNYSSNDVSGGIRKLKLQKVRTTTQAFSR
jgi:hypothetical protein